MRMLTVLLMLMAVPAWADEARDWQAILAAHKGHPWIAHFWGMTCGPCQLELPQWGAFHHGHPGAEMVLIQADPFPTADAAAQRTLDKAGLGDLRNWAPPLLDERSRFAIDPDWAGELPMTLLFDGDGHATRIVGQADFKTIDDWYGRVAGISPHSAPGAR